VFDEGDTHRVYKGEGTIQFTCFEPFAKSAFARTATKEDLRAKYPNVDEWWDAAHIEADKNFGDIPTSFKITVSGQGTIGFEGDTVSWDLPEEVTATLDTKLGLLKGKDGKLYNQYLTGNSTLKIPVGAKTTDYPDLIYDCYYF
jgi:hypothetical protein